MTERLFAKLFFSFCAVGSLAFRVEPMTRSFQIYVAAILMSVWFDWLWISAGKAIKSYVTAYPKKR